MLLKYLFLLLLVNVPLPITGLYINGAPRELHRDYAKPMPYYGPYGNQQAMVCIPVPLTLQTMYLQHAGRPEHSPATPGGSYPFGTGHPPSYQSPPGASNRPHTLGEPLEPQHTKPAPSAGSYPGGFWSLGSLADAGGVAPTSASELPSMSVKSDN